MTNGKIKQNIVKMVPRNFSKAKIGWFKTDFRERFDAMCGELY